ncbi:MAG TPA: FkbM family methyltransferase [Solirubrobacteraceae bacterium]|nr:FkbM family methyltransferase [Solirubrobacteraceae bacterium]
MEKHVPRNDAGAASAPTSSAYAQREVVDLVDALKALSEKKQIAVCEAWQGPELKLAHGVTVTARSKKERRRFVRPVDDEVLEWFESFGDGDVFYDIGANCGSLTLAAAGMHRNRITIVAIEPGYANFESLVRNLSRNGMLSFVIPLQIALLERTGLESINYYGSTLAGASLHAVGRAVEHEDKEFTPVETQMIPGYALDDVIEALELPEPTHLKIDVDGAEGALLRGATRTLARGGISELLLEIVDHDRSGSRLESARALLEQHGYELAETFDHHPDNSESFVADHLFRRSDAAGERPPGPSE